MRLGNIEIKVQQFADGRWGFDQYLLGQRNRIRCRSKQQANARATEFAVKLANGRTDLLQVDQATLQRFLKWEAASKSSPPIADVLKEFVKLKNGKSSHHVRALDRDLNLLAEFVGPTQAIATITMANIQRFLDSRNVGDRRKFNLRAQIVMLFRWARRMSYVPDATTEAEKVEQIEKRPGKPNVLTPSELRVLLANVNEVYLPWLAIGAFAGVRTEEIAPRRGSTKSPLQWEDFDWANQVIVLRAETAKTKEDREVPISENLAQWLAPWRNASGPVLGDDCKRQPSEKEAARLGKLIGGWKHNCLRDSYCSYRTALTQNVPQTSYEMGNSIAMVKRSYHRRQPLQAAQEWFNIQPPEAGTTNIVDFRPTQAGGDSSLSL